MSSVLMVGVDGTGPSIVVGTSRVLGRCGTDRVLGVGHDYMTGRVLGVGDIV